MGREFAVIIQFSTYLESKMLIVRKQFNKTGVPWWRVWAFILPLKPLSLTIITPLGFFTVGTYLDIKCLEYRKGLSCGLWLIKNKGWRWKWERTTYVRWEEIQ